jgi:hypothetical protein
MHTANLLDQWRALRFDRLCMTIILHCGITLLALVILAGCTSTTDQSTFSTSPTDSGSRYSQFGLPGSEGQMQNTDLDD